MPRSQKAVKVDAGRMVAGMTLVVQVTGVRRAAARLRVMGWLIRLAARVGGLRRIQIVEHAEN